MCDLTCSIYSNDVAPADLTLLHGDAVADEFTGVIHIFVGDEREKVEYYDRNFDLRVKVLDICLVTHGPKQTDRKPRSFNLGGPENTDHLSSEGAGPSMQNNPTCQKQSLSRCRVCRESRYH
ncbi:hypothetical protein ACTXT7_007405 [Hymenolepis weldensis]